METDNDHSKDSVMEKRSIGWPVYFSIGLLILFVSLFVVAMLAFNPNADAEATDEPDLAIHVDTLLQGADAERGEGLIVTYGCAACHIDGAERGVAPSFAGVGERAETRKPPLTAAQYIYESITHPAAYVVEDFAPAMPQNYAQTLSEQELGDIIAYLLVQ
jgi:cytochrome c551/c552